jgi:malonyl-CoA O-methyltransferase
MRAEEQAMRAYWPEVRNSRALDLASGSGRYTRMLQESGAADVVALDFCEPMLRQVATAQRVCASMMQLPFAANRFDVIVSGLAVGHAPDLGAWMREASRVLDRGGVLLYSDFHADAAQAGLTRSFKDAEARDCTVPHQSYGVDSQRAAAQAAGLSIEAVHEVRVGEELREAFPKSQEFYRRWHGLALVLVVRARK